MKRRQLQPKLGRLSGQSVVFALAVVLAGCGDSKSKLGGAVLSASEECSANADDCDVNATCTAHVGGFSCECNVGFEGDGHACKPTTKLVDECSLGTAKCQAHASCVDTQDAFECACDEGYVDENKVCKALGPSCEALICAANAQCSDAGGAAKCVCKLGFAGNGMQCSAIDRCSSLDCGDHGVCSTNAQNASCSCDSGYAWDGKICGDVDECKAKLSDCAADALCTNTPGRFTCACKPGFVGNGKQCLPGDPCAPDAAKCGPHSMCASDPMTGPTCVCDAGYEKRGEQCQEVHACEGNPCDERGDAGATCVEKLPATEYSCTCSAGYDSSTGSTPVCRNINECRNNPCDDRGDTGATCAEMSPGNGYACACTAGFASSGGQSPSCANIDDCKDNPCDNNGDGAARCTERQGAPGYTCSCTTPAFESTSGDKPSCRNVNECSGYPCARAGDSGATCTENNPGPGYSCSCTANFTSMDGSCVPNTGCQDNPCDNNGDTGAVCRANDPPPGYSCSCTSAFQPARGSCVPITDCQDNPCNDDGDSGATCKENDPDSGYSCECSGAFQPADGSCKAIADCENNPCDDQGDASASCRENDPNAGYTCSCSTDYEAGAGANPVCKRRDACAIGGNANCVTSAGNTCTNAAAPNTGYSCDCTNNAYTPGPDNTSCVTQLDQCAQDETNDCKPQQRCVNLPDAVGTPGYGCTNLLGMWITNGIQLYDNRVPIPMGSTLPISGTGFDANAVVHALAVHPSTQQVWGLMSSSSGGTTYLSALNINVDGSGKPTGATAMNVVNVRVDLRAMAFDDSGTLWAVSNSNLDGTSLPRNSILPPLRSALYTVNTGNGTASYKRDLEPPPFPGDRPTSNRCPNSSWKYANATFQTDRETLVFASGTGKLYRFLGKRLEAINTSDLTLNDTDMKFASDVPGGEPRTIWAAIWDWPVQGQIGFTSPNAVYCDSNIGEYVFTSDTSGNIKRAFTQTKTLLVRSLGLVAKDLGTSFRSMLPTAEMCGGDQSCDGGPYCNGLVDCTKFGTSSCAGSGDCSAIECRVNTTCGGGL